MTRRHVVTLADLPAPPPAKTGWPWTEGPTHRPQTLPDGTPWPRITIVTPSYNQGPFIEETIRSVLLQGYPNLEYIVMDGGSTDDSLTIIRKYAPWLAYWESMVDRGQAHAINKGFARATGTVLGWLNSDDLFEPLALEALMAFRSAQTEAVAWVGACLEIERGGEPIREIQARVGGRDAFGDWAFGALFYQPACLFAAQAFRTVGGVREHLHYVMDVDLWLRLLPAGPFATTTNRVARARIHAEAKTQRDQDAAEAETIAVCIDNGLAHVARRRLIRYGEREVRRHQIRSQRVQGGSPDGATGLLAGKAEPRLSLWRRGWLSLHRRWWGAPEPGEQTG